jgi:dihydrofolate reductase
VINGEPTRKAAVTLALKELIDEMHIAISPVLLGQRERLFEGVDLPALGCACTQRVASPRVMHVVITRQ